MKKIWKWVYLILLLLFIYLPILILAVYSFTDSTNIGAIRHFSLHNYATLFMTEELRNMIAGTLLLAIGSAAVATVLGTMGAIGAFYSRKRVGRLISTMNQVPVVNRGDRVEVGDGALHVGGAGLAQLLGGLDDVRLGRRREGGGAAPAGAVPPLWLHAL